MSNANNARLIFTKTVLWAILGLASAVVATRFVKGLGATTALTDSTPWGLWIGFDVLAGVALAAGGFVLAATVYIFRLDRYHPLVRPAILTAFLGYVAVVLGLLVDLGKPWNLWRPIFYWQTDSPLFEVAWCVMLYSTVLLLEFAPVVFEGLRWEKPRRILRRISLALVIAGIGLSTLHQSSLGTLFLLARDRMHPLWDTPLQPLLFLISAIALGLSMVAVEGMATAWLYRRKPEWHLIRGLTKAAAVVLALYLAIRLGDLALRDQFMFTMEGSWASTLFLVEILLSGVVPALLFSLPSTRSRPGALATGALLSVSGFVLHRADIGGLAHMSITGDNYLPALTELTASLGVVSLLALVFLFIVERFPVWEETPSVTEHFTPPMRDPVAGTYFGRPWFGRAQLCALSWVTGVVAGVILLEITIAGAADPIQRPVRRVRPINIERLDTNIDGNLVKQVRMVSAGTVLETGENNNLPALLIDGDRSGTFVMFEHKGHVERMGGDASCRQCHHATLPLARATSCTECHRDMYRASDIYDHEDHVAALGGNRSCERCHADPAAPKTRPASTPCHDCHHTDATGTMPGREDDTASSGLAPGYRAAMHDLCIGCHRKHEIEKGIEEPNLSRCHACHRDHSGTGEEIRLREGWTMAAAGRMER